MVYVYRYHPEVGRQGATLEYLVDLKTGEADDGPEVVSRFPAPLAKEEQGAAIQLAREKSEAVKALVAGAAKDSPLHTEVLCPLVTQASGPHVPGDRVASVRFIVGQGKDAKATVVWVNLTRRVVTGPPGRDRAPVRP
jgi:hypothetical protein